ncbi:MAG: 30S ribosomal protein S8 [bacterium]
MVTDPISDFIIRLQNASRTNKESVSLPFSKMKLAIAEVLKREGYLSDVEGKSKTGNTLSVGLKYKNGKPVITGVKRISKPSRRMYMGVKELRPVKRGYGLLVLSTPAGVVTGKQAREQKVGGEALFEIW